MVKPSRVLDETLDEADVPYEETRLAKRATGARRRLVGLLLAGSLALVLEAVLRQPLWAIPAAGVALSAWGIHRGRLGGIVGAGFAGLTSTLIGLGVLGVLRPGGSDLVAALVATALGAATLPDVLTLVRDAELQHAYGRWAKRDA